MEVGFLMVAALPLGWVMAWLVGHLAGRPGPPTWVMIGAALAAVSVAVTVVPMPLAVAVAAVGCAVALLAAIDVLIFRLPDILTLPLALAGLYFGPLLSGMPLSWHVGGACAGYALIAGLRWIHARLRESDGIGLGDAKLLAAAGAWLGWPALPSVILLAAGGGLLIAGVNGLRRGRAGLRQAVPFGVPLGLAFWLVLLLDTAAG